MILKILILVLIFASLSLVLFFLSCLLAPAVKEQTEIRDNMIFTPAETLFAPDEKNEENLPETDSRIVLSEYGIYQIQEKISRFSRICFKIWRYCYKLIKK